MRALLSWDVDRADPELQQILVAIGGCLPQHKLKSLTNYAAIIEPVNAKEFNSLYQQLASVALTYPGRLFFVFSLHESKAPVWGIYRGPAPTIVNNAPPAGPGQ